MGSLTKAMVYCMKTEIGYTKMMWTSSTGVTNIMTDGKASEQLEVFGCHDDMEEVEHRSQPGSGWPRRPPLGATLADQVHNH